MNYQVFQAINNWAGHFSWLDNLAIFLTNYSLEGFVLLLLFLWFTSDEAQRTVLLAGLSGGLALAFVLLITIFYFHPRPFMEHSVVQLIPHAAESSFPSDHATGAFAIAIAVLVRNRKWGYPMLIFASLTAVSRIFVGVHYPADILGSLFVAIIAVLIVSKLENHLEFIIKIVLTAYCATLYKIPILRKLQRH